ncbi:MULTISPECIES: VirB4 family type IV secretion system protein [unclassified Paenibacillus]|uniref:VirB4 family type IV secretion system protein n=1 Tax=unclassified Paenibacillus TaxID=185978 RepID=UPI0027838E67|nr:MULTISPECIES: hypothetical protein [unclassified Paenibacillus]MDQ0896342.1 hypothetical protein [Paenibacillus sp. V4I7]MDQ0914115.1 hypothetical protein [Paenibacillus sp. V4I5]
MMKNLLNKIFKKKPSPVDSSELQSQDLKSGSPVPALSYFDFVAPTGFEVPVHPRDLGYVLDGPAGGYPYRSFIIEFGTTTLTTGALDVLYRSGPVNMMFYITKLTRNQAIRTYKNAATDEGTRLINMLKSGNEIEAREAQKSVDAAGRLLDELSDGYNDGFLGTCLVTVFAKDEKGLDNVGMHMQDDLLGNDHFLRVLYNRQRSGYISTLPIANNKIDDRNDRRFFDRTAIVAASPFYSSEIPFSGGVPLGVNQHSGTMEFLNVFAKYLDNYSSMIVGSSGSGKSFSNKYISSSQICLGYRIFSIDPDGENGPVCRLLGGREVEIREGGDVCINPFAISEEEVEITDEVGRKKAIVVVPLGPKIGQLLKFFDRLLGGMVSEEETHLKKAILDTYQDAGITEDPSTLYEPGLVPEFNRFTREVEEVRKRKPERTLTDMYKRLLKNCAVNVDWETLEFEDLKEKYAERLLTVIRGYLRDFPDGALIDGQTNFGDDLPVDNMLDNVCWINFNIKAIESSRIFDIMMLVITTLGWEYFIKRPSLRKFRKRLKIEEAWKMKRIPGAMEFIEDLARRSRKYNAGADIITQDLTPFLEDPSGIALVKNATTALFLRIGQISNDEKLQLKSIFNLSEGELEVICRRPPEREEDDSRGEGIMRVGGSSAFIKVTVSKEMRRFIDTDPDWLQEQGLLPEVG